MADIAEMVARVNAEHWQGEGATDDLHASDGGMTGAEDSTKMKKTTKCGTVPAGSCTSSNESSTADENGPVEGFAEVQFRAWTDAIAKHVVQWVTVAMTDEMFPLWAVGGFSFACAIFGMGRVLMWLVYPLFFIVGAVGAVGVVCWPTVHTLFARISVVAPPNALDPDLASAVERGQRRSNNAPKLDSRLTGAGPIDDELNDIINYMIRDCVLSWYVYGIDDSSTSFLVNSRTLMDGVHRPHQCPLGSVASYLMYADVRSILMTSLHSKLRLFRAAQSQVAESAASSKQDGKDGPSSEDMHRRLKELGVEENTAAALAGPQALEDAFFKMDTLFGKICQNREIEAQYCRDLAEVLCFLLLPEGAFDVPVARYMIREMIALQGIQTSVDLVSNPDYVNQTVATSVADMCLTVSSIHDVIETSHSLAELEIISDNIYADIKHRQELASAAEAKAADSGGDQGSSAEEDEEADRSTPASRLSKHRKSIAELTRTRNQVQARSEVVAQGLNAVKSQQQVQVQMLPFETILSGSNKLALSKFRDYLIETQIDHYLDFYLNSKSFSSIRKSKVGAPALRDEAVKIFVTYFRKGAARRIQMETGLYKRIERVILDTRYPVKPDLFSTAQQLMFHTLERFHVSFALTAQYQDLLEGYNFVTATATAAAAVAAAAAAAGSPPASPASSPQPSLDAPQKSQAGSDSDSGGICASPSSPLPISPTRTEIPSPDNRLRSVSILSVDSLYMDLDSVASLASAIGPGGAWAAKLVEAQEHNGDNRLKKKYITYTIRVLYTGSNGDRYEWECSRRYSEFDDLHKLLQRKFSKEVKEVALSLPSKKLFGNTDPAFIKKRGEKLIVWLAVLTSSSFLRMNVELELMVRKFLMEGAYTKEGGLAHKIKARLRASTSSKHHDDSNNGEQHTSSSPSYSPQGSGGGGGGGGSGGTNHVNSNAAGEHDDIGDGLETEEIPVRILMLIMDEIFQLKRNKWLRRAVKGVVFTLIRGFFGDNINRSLTEAVHTAFSPTNVVMYCKLFKESMWPDGVPAASGTDGTDSVRDEESKRRTSIEAKAKLFGLLPEDLKRLVGSANAKEGVNQVFEMIQHQAMNRRLVLAVLEALVVCEFTAAPPKSYMCSQTLMVVHRSA